MYLLHSIYKYFGINALGYENSLPFCELIRNRVMLCWKDFSLSKRSQGECYYLFFYSRYKSSLFALLEMKEVLMDVFSRCRVLWEWKWKKRIGFQWCLIQDQEDLLKRYRKFVVDCSRFIGKYNGIVRQGRLKCHRICHLWYSFLVRSITFIKNSKCEK